MTPQPRNVVIDAQPASDSVEVAGAPDFSKMEIDITDILRFYVMDKDDPKEIAKEIIKVIEANLLQ